MQTAVTFPPEQLEALKKVYNQRASREHPVDLRLSIPFISRGFYFVLLAGKEKRQKQRRKQEKGQHPLLKTGNIIFLTGLLFSLAILSVGGAYFLEQQETVLSTTNESTANKE